MNDEREADMNGSIRAILLEDASGPVPERLRLRVARVTAATGRPGPGWRRLARRPQRRLLLAIGLVAALAVLIAGPTLLSLHRPQSGPGVAATGTQPTPWPTNAPTDDPSAQLIATGRVIDQGGNPLAGIYVELDLLPSPAAMQSAQAGQPLVLIGVSQTSTDGDGAFRLHLRPTAGIRAAAAENGGYANFQVAAYDSGRYGMWGFSLQISGDGFAGLPEPITITTDAFVPIPTAP
jgi:hypothetical protein